MPVRLDAILGHDAAIEDLLRRREQGRIPHALLIEGPDGIGKRTLALAFAALLVCERPERGGACGACPGCAKMDGGGHPDVHRLPLREEVKDEPAPKPIRKGRPASVEPPPSPPAYRSHIRVDDVRALERALRYRALEGRSKVAIIDEAHRLGPGPHPQNALLKTLEEPPGDTHLILVTAHRGLLLPTITSRCQSLRLGPLSAEATGAVLRRAAPGLSEVDRRFLVALSGGAPGLALALDLDTLREARASVVELDASLDRAAGALGRGGLDAAIRLAEDRKNLGSKLDTWASWARDLVLAASGIEGGLAHVDLLDELRGRARARGVEESLRRADAILEARRQLELPNNLNAKMIMERLCLTLLDHVPLARVRP